jgi:phosphate transport system substrate-binding protein
MRDVRLIATLGRGGMAEVFLAARGGVAGFTRLVVIKRLRTDLADVADLERHRGLMLDEARLAARLRHPNIVQTFEVDLEGGSPQIAMEYLEGQALSAVVTAARKAGTAVSVPITLAVIDSVLAALAYAHDLIDYDGEPLGVVHRDVSPQNIFWTYDGEIKLMDFGVAKFARGRAATEAGTIKGKLTYMAPEQARGAAVDRRADLFACGIVLWELLAGKRLFRADSEAASLNRLLYEPVPALDAVRPGIDPRLAALCAKALERAPERRYESASAMRADLARAMGEHVPRREDLAAFVQPLFGGERREVAARIREALAGADASGPLPSLVDDGANGSGRVPSMPDRTLDETVQARPPTSITPSRVETPIVPRRGRGAIAGALAVAALGVGGVVGWQVWERAGAGEAAVAAGAPAPAAGSAPTSTSASRTQESYALRLCGSNTIGAELAPALVEAYLAHEGATDVARAPGATDDEHVVSARLRGERIAIDVRARGSATAFEGLAAGACDVGMASRAIDPGEEAKLEAAGLGDLRSPATEHVVALDGIAVIVQPNNPIAVLDRAQLHDIFTGKVRDWKDVGGAPGPITVFARDDKSGTYDTFKSLVLGKEPLAAGATRFAASDALADAVASDPQAIGFIGLAYVRSAKAIAVGDVGAPPMLPTSFTVTTEGYMLARRLYWYTPPRPRSPRTAELVTFALSSDGQAAVARAGFVDLSVSLAPPPRCDDRCPRRYARLIAHAQRIALDFRFRYGSDDLDSRATRDLDRVVQYLRGQPGARLFLLGFSDASGDAGANLALSVARARTIARDLEMRGVHAAVVEGFGDALPVASNATELDRQRNRRVEAWTAPP